MRVLLVDDHELIWNGTRRLLERVFPESSGGAMLAFEAVRNLAEAEARFAGQSFELVLLDFHLPGIHGVAALHRMQALFEGATICMLSAENGPAHIRELLDAGAAGFVPKSYGEAEMAMALHLVLLQKVYAPAEFLLNEDIVRRRDSGDVADEELSGVLEKQLSVRQRQVLRLALQGLPNKAIARRLDIADGTVKAHLHLAYRVLGVRTRVAALCRVLQAGAAGVLEGA